MRFFLIFLFLVPLTCQYKQCDSWSSESDASSDSGSSSSSSSSSSSEEVASPPTRKPQQSPPMPHGPPPKPQKSPPPPPPRVPKCPQDWQEFQRISGKWCIHVFAGMVTRNQAQAACEGLGATLSGMENPVEKNYIHVQGVHYLRAQGMRYGAVWLGIVRKLECRGWDNAMRPECWGSGGFYWNDGSTFNTDMMTWAIGKPDNRGGDQTCVYMYLIDAALSPDGNHPGTLDDIECDTANNGVNSKQSVRAYACGMKPV